MGASTIAELTTAGRPAILVPFPAATDDHQTANAREITKAGGARTIPQPQFTPPVLARQIEAMAADPVALGNAAARALSVGRPHAARDLADLVERIGNREAPLLVGPALRSAAISPPRARRLRASRSRAPTESAPGPMRSPKAVRLSAKVGPRPPRRVAACGGGPHP